MKIIFRKRTSLSDQDIINQFSNFTELNKLLKEHGEWKFLSAKITDDKDEPVQYLCYTDPGHWAVDLCAINNGKPIFDWYD
jgi:hypothetical protein